MEHPYGQYGRRVSRLPRRQFVGGAAGVGLAAAVAGLVGCSSNKHTSTKAATAAQNAAATASSTARPVIAASPASAALDSTKGKPGGTLVFQDNSYPAGFTLVTGPISAKITGLVHNGLLAFNFGRPPSNGLDVVAEPDLAQALPEQPDPQTLIFKLNPGVKFHNGREMTAQDVQYSYEQWAHNPKAVGQANWLWYDHTETPDAQTAVVKTKAPYADGVLSCAAHADGFIMAKEFQEGGDTANKMLGSGPYLFDSTTAPVSTDLKKNPNYFAKPYPYFDKITALGSTDVAKQGSDFISKQVQLTYSLNGAIEAQIKQSRPDAQQFRWFSAANAVYPRCDQPPFNDKRVRQALSMAINRKVLTTTLYNGEGEDDQFLTPIFGPIWGFRKPSQLGAAAAYWNFDPQAAKQLLQAAGVTLPIQSPMTHWDANVVGQQLVDNATLVEAHWKDAGVANINDVTQTAPEFARGVSLGNYDGLAFGVSSQQQPVFGTIIKNIFWSPPEGVKSPTPNVGHVNDPQLSALLDKQLTQLNLDERKQTLHQIEDVLAEQQYRIVMVTSPYSFFTDGTLRDNVAPKWSYGGSDHYIQYWWYA